jgi:flagellar basal body-associated protein FliL
VTPNVKTALALAAMNTIPIGGLALAIATERGHGAVVAADQASVPPLGPLVQLNDLTVMLRSDNAARYARVALDLEAASAADKERIIAHMSHIREMMIGYFSERTPDELRGGVGLTNVKEAVQKRVNGLLESPAVRAVYVSDLVIQ